jgi:hypothetical protein
MTDQKSSKGDDGRGQPASATDKTVEPRPSDPRLIPGGSFRSARVPIGVNAMDHYTESPAVQAALPDLSDTPGWNVFPKSDRR